jgi:hypothetical protein
LVLTAEQQWMMATVYEKAAADIMGVPAPQRAAFARKAKRFRMLARIAARIEATPAVKQAPLLKPRQTPAAHELWASSLEWRPMPKFRTLAERLEKARAARTAGGANQLAAPSSQEKGAETSAHVLE